MTDERQVLTPEQVSRIESALHSETYASLGPSEDEDYSRVNARTVLLKVDVQGLIDTIRDAWRERDQANARADRELRRADLLEKTTPVQRRGQTMEKWYKERKG